MYRQAVHKQYVFIESKTNNGITFNEPAKSIVWLRTICSSLLRPITFSEEIHELEDAFRGDCRPAVAKYV